MGSEIENFYGLDEASNFFLANAFSDIKDAFLMERAHIIFAKEIMKIDAPENWEMPDLPRPIEQMLAFKGNVLPDEKLEEISDCWSNAQLESLKNNDIRFKKNHEIKAIEIVGHILNLHAFVETALNRHLYLSKVSGIINGEIFQSLDRTEFIPKLLYLFKDEVSKNEIKIQQFRTLNRLRNSAVHFKKDSRARIKPTINELLQIWSEVGVLLTLITKNPNEKVISSYTRLVKEAFL